MPSSTTTDQPAAYEDLPRLTTSERSAFKRCPQRWYWAYREGLVPYDDVAPALWFGIGVHIGLDMYYKRKGTKRDLDGAVSAFETYCDEDDLSVCIREKGEDGQAEWHNARALGKQMLIGHHAFWGGDPDWDVIDTERPFEIDIPHPFKPGEDIVTFTSTLDGVYRERSTKRIKLVEHKTAASISTGHLPLDDQGGAYWALAPFILAEAGILKPREEIAGVTYNFLRKGMPDERPKDAHGYAHNKPLKQDYIDAINASAGCEVPIPKNWKLTDLEAEAKQRGLAVLGERSKVQPAPLFHREDAIRTRGERATQIDRIGKEALHHAHLRERTDMLYKSPRAESGSGCMCPFREMCQLQDQGSPDWIEFKKAVFLRRNPYDRYSEIRKSS